MICVCRGVCVCSMQKLISKGKLKYSNRLFQSIWQHDQFNYNYFKYIENNSNYTSLGAVQQKLLVAIDVIYKFTVIIFWKIKLIKLEKLILRVYVGKYFCMHEPLHLLTHMHHEVKLNTVIVCGILTIDKKNTCLFHIN